MPDVFAASSLNQATIAQSNTQALTILALQANTAIVTQVGVATNDDDDNIIA